MANVENVIPKIEDDVMWVVFLPVTFEILGFAYYKPYAEDFYRRSIKYWRNAKIEGSVLTDIAQWKTWKLLNKKN